MGKKQSKDRPAVVRVKGGTAPPPLARTRSGAPRPKPAPITIRRADGTVEMMSAAEFRDRNGAPSGGPDAAERAELRKLLAAYRASGNQNDLRALRRFSERTGREAEVERALRRMTRSNPESSQWR
jgi:hypothetical protein